MDKSLKQILDLSSDPVLVENAFRVAQEAHKEQKRSSGEDYIWHPLGVAQTLSKMKLDPKTIAAGLLHDVPDDTKVTLEDIEKQFGKEVAFLVNGVSKLGKLRYPKEELEVKSIDQRLEEPIDLRAENLRKMFFAMAEDLRVIFIKLADRLNNMETLDALPPQKRQRIALETLEIFAPLANRLGMGEVKGQLEDLAFPHLYPREFDTLKQLVKDKYKNRQSYLEKVKPVLLSMLAKENIKPIDVHTRAKHYWSLYQKLIGHEMNIEKIYDLVALRVIVDDVKTCYQILGIIHNNWKPLPGRIKDYIAFPKPNGYKALHTTCFCLDGIIIEIQIKTKEMHDEAEKGICAHWAAKEKIDLKNQEKRFSWVKQLRDWQKDTVGSKEFFDGLKIDFFRNRIFVFTPQGDVIDLPESATPVDFAYAVHSEVGNKCSGAKVNGKISPLSHPLKNGDLVEIITDKNRKPARDWLEFVKTSLARARIKEWLKKESRPENINRGVKLLNDELRQIQGTTWINISQNKKDELLKAFPYKDLDTLLATVGEGEISPKEIIKSLFKEREVLSLIPQKPSPLLKIEKEKRDGNKISLAGTTGILINLAKCCLPQPNDKIKGYITRNKGASVHKVDCDNFIGSQKKWPNRIVEAAWGETEKISYAVNLKIKADDRVGLFRDISSAISSMGINIMSFEAQTPQKGQSATLEIKTEISSLDELENLFSQLKQVSGVLEIKKV